MACDPVTLQCTCVVIGLTAVIKDGALCHSLPSLFVPDGKPQPHLWRGTDRSRAQGTPEPPRDGALQSSHALGFYAQTWLALELLTGGVQLVHV